MSSPRIGSLFSGYGGLDRAVQSVVGGHVVWVCDNDPGAARILGYHHPDVPNLGDITAVDWSAVEPVDVLALGFPCQDISSAGKQAGIRPGTRSGLWTHAAFAISQLRPRLVVIENVRNLVSAPAHSDVEPCAFCLGDDTAGALRALGAVLGDLADLGFDAEWHGLPASAVGAPHERWREFIAAYPAGQPWSEWDLMLPSAAVTLLGQGGEALLEDGLTGSVLPGVNVEQVAEVGGGFGADGDGHGGSEPSIFTARLTPESKDFALLPTPAVNDMGEGKTIEAWDAWTAEMKARHGNGNGHGPSLAIEAQRLLPTPSVADSDGGHLTRSGARSGELLLPGVARELALLPTPRTTDASGIKTSERARRLYSSKDSIGDVVEQDAWGKYGAAVRRWEAVTRCAPAPTQLSSKGTPQLAPVFSEWMMGLPLGHVTDPAIWDGMSDKRGKPASASAKRNAQLRAIGNGVLPLQAATALRVCLARALSEVAA